MKKAFLITITFLFLSLISLLSPNLVQADIGCPSDGEVTGGWDSSMGGEILLIDIRVTNANANSFYDLVYGVSGYHFEDDCYASSETRVSCTISVKDLNDKTSWETNSGAILFHLDKGTDNCGFNLQHSNIDDAIDDAEDMAGDTEGSDSDSDSTSDPDSDSTVGTTGPASITGDSGVESDDADCETVVHTGLGNIPIEPLCLTLWVLKNGILMGSGIAFLLSVWGAITILLAAGNPDKINEGKQIITSAITGLLVIILSIFLLRLIGYDILKLPGFTQ